MGTGQAQSVQSLESIQAAAERHVREQLPQSAQPGKSKYFITAGHLDPRLRLAACAAPLDTFFPNGGTPDARATIGVRCAANVQWTVYVQVSVEVEAPVLVLRRPLPRHSAVTAADVTQQVRRLPGVDANFIDDAAKLSGRRMKRALAAGTPLTAAVLVPDLLVKRGQQVTLVAGDGPIEIRARGKALSDGAMADHVRVQNVTSLKVVEGVVESAGVVRIGS